MSNLSLLSSTNRMEIPFIKVTIGEFTFGVYTRETANNNNVKYQGNLVRFPNYVQSLNIRKINGKVNKYTFKLVYPIKAGDDPNLFEKIFSKNSKQRRIVFSYGDLSVPNYIYKNEEALITGVKRDFNMQSSTITYNVSAIGSGFLGNSGVYSFPETNDKPSSVIKLLLFNEYYGLLDIFTGMRNKGLVAAYNLIPENDASVNIEKKVNITPLEYLSYLVDCMRPISSAPDTLNQGGFYTLTLVDQATQMYKDEQGKNFVFNGPYFKIIETSKARTSLDTYTIDIGWPSENLVTQFSIDDDDTYSLLYDYQNNINDEGYVERLNDNGELERVYAPAISSRNDKYKTREQEKIWWTKVTEFPIKATITVKGLLRPAILMNYVKLNVLFYGRKYLGSGLYVITGQEDNIDFNGFRTTLNLLRVQGDTYQES